MKAYKGIIFDLDGTLLNTLEDMADAVNYTMKVYHLAEWSIEEVRGFVGNGMRRLLELCVPMGTKNSEFEAILSTFLVYYKEHYDIKTCPYDHIIDLLEKLKNENYQIAIVSNKIDSAVKALNAKYFETWINVAIGETKEVKRKPAPDMVDACLKAMSLDSSEVVYVGDSEVDLLTAQNAGMDCISVGWGFRDASWLIEHGAKLVVSDIDGLENAIRG